jgi:DNA-binding NarL/FixJ family response regulator
MPEPADQIRILVVDDHTLLREALVAVLTGEPGFAVVGQAGDGESGIRLADQTRPEVVLLDLQMPDDRPADTVMQLMRMSPTPKVIILSMHDAPHLVNQMLSLGARGYLHKAISRQDLVMAIYTICRSDQTVTVMVPHGTAGQPPEPERSAVLSEREQEVLALVARALSNRQIAIRLDITEGTVKRHLRNIFGKLGAVSRIDAVNKGAAASAIGLVRPRAHGAVHADGQAQDATPAHVESPARAETHEAEGTFVRAQTYRHAEPGRGAETHGRAGTPVIS